MTRFALDAEAICEAAGRSSLRFVALKSREQHDAQSPHRIRSERIKQRTATVNQITNAGGPVRCPYLLRAIAAVRAARMTRAAAVRNRQAGYCCPVNVARSPEDDSEAVCYLLEERSNEI